MDPHGGRITTYLASPFGCRGAASWESFLALPGGDFGSVLNRRKLRRSSVDKHPCSELMHQFCPVFAFFVLLSNVYVFAQCVCSLHLCDFIRIWCIFSLYIYFSFVMCTIFYCCLFQEVLRSCSSAREAEVLVAESSVWQRQPM